MRRVSAIVAVLAVTVLAITMLGEISQSAPAPESRYTELVKGKCRFLPISREPEVAQVKRCPGFRRRPAGNDVRPHDCTLGLRWSKRRLDNVVSGWSLGDKVEWRGVTGARGFMPYAAIVRVIVKDPETLGAGAMCSPSSASPTRPPACWRRSMSPPTRTPTRSPATPRIS